MNDSAKTAARDSVQERTRHYVGGIEAHAEDLLGRIRDGRERVLDSDLEELERETLRSSTLRNITALMRHGDELLELVADGTAKRDWPGVLEEAEDSYRRLRRRRVLRDVNRVLEFARARRRGTVAQALDRELAEAIADDILHTERYPWT